MGKVEFKDFFKRFLYPLGMDIIALLLICNWYEHNRLLAVGLGIVFLTLIVVDYSHFKLVLVIFSSLFGVAGEILCCHYGLWVYNNSSVWGIPMWLPMVWPILLMTFSEVAGFLNDACERLLKPKVYVILIHILRGTILVYAFFTFIFIHKVIASVFAVFLALMLIFSRNRPYYVVLFLMAGSGGALGETICIANGVWYYKAFMFAVMGITIPLSLPLAWGLSANIIYLLSRGISGRHASGAYG